MYKSEGLQQPDKKSANKRIMVIIIAVLVVAVSVFTVRVIGDENDGVDHIIQYSNEEIWELTYLALGVDPYEENSYENRKATAPLGSSSNVLVTGNRELDNWINREVQGTYLLDTISEKDGCEALLVMNPDENELSIIALNLEDDFHTFNMKITNPEPLAADIEVYKVENIELGMSLGSSGNTTKKPVNIQDNADDLLSPEIDTGYPIEEKIDENARTKSSSKSTKEDSTQGTKPLDEEENAENNLPSIGDFDGLLNTTSTSSTVAHDSINKTTYSINELLTPVNSGADTGGVPVKKDIEVKNDDADVSEKEESLNSEDGLSIPETKKDSVEKEIDSTEADGSITYDKAASTFKEEAIPIEKPEQPMSEDIQTTIENKDDTRQESISEVKTDQKAIDEDEIEIEIIVPETIEELEEPDTSLQKNESKGTSDYSSANNEEAEIEKFQKNSFESPKNGVLVTVPSNGVGIAKITINENLLRLTDKGFSVQDGDVFVLEKNSMTKTSYLTRSRDDHKLRFGVEDDTQIKLNGTGTEKITIELNTETNLTVGQIITSVDTLYITESSTMMNKRSRSTGEESHLTISSPRTSNKDYSDGISGSNNIEISGNINVDVLSEQVGGSGISAINSVTINNNAVVTTEGESFGIRVSGNNGDLIVEEGDLKATAQPSRSNKGKEPKAGIFASGTLSFSGGSLSSTVIQDQTMPQDDTIVRTLDEIHSSAETFAYHVNDVNLVTSTGAKLIASGGDVGICAEGQFFIEGNADVDITAYWAGIIMNGSNSVIQSDSSKKAPNIKITATGKTENNIPYGYGILVRDSLDIKKKNGSYQQGSVDHYNHDTAPKLNIDATQIGIYIQEGTFSILDGTNAFIYGGVTGEYQGRTPVYAPHTYGVYLDEAVDDLYMTYNTKVEVLSGNIGIFSGNVPIGKYDYCDNSIFVENSTYLKSIGYDAGMAGNMNFYGQFSVQIDLHGNKYGGTIITKDSFSNLSDMEIGGQDENIGATHVNTIFHATATEGIGLVATTSVYIYDSIYILFEGDIAGFYGYRFRSRNWYDGEIVMVAKTKAYANYNPKDVIPPKSENFLETYPIRKDDAMAIHIDFWGEGQNTQVLEIYDAEDSGDYGWYAQAMGVQGDYNGVFSGARRLFSSSDATTAYNWSLGIEKEVNKLEYVNPETISKNDIDNFDVYSYMQMDRGLIPHNDDEFKFERYSVGSGSGVRTARGVGLVPQITKARAAIIADTEDPKMRRTVPGWSATTGHNDYRSGLFRHRIIFLNTDINASPEGHLEIEFHSKAPSGSWLPLSLSEANRVRAQYKIEYLPLDAPANTPKTKSIVNFHENPTGITKHVFDRMKEGYYWITDMDIEKSNYEYPPTIELKIHNKKVEDGISDEYPYYSLVAEILNDDNGEFVTLRQFERMTVHIMKNYGPESPNMKEPPHGFSQGYNDSARFDNGVLYFKYKDPTFEYRFEARSRADNSVKISGKVKITRVAYGVDQETDTVVLNDTHSFEDDAFVVYPERSYKIVFEPDSKDYLNSEITLTNTLGSKMTGTPGSGDDFEVSNAIKSYIGDLTFKVRLFKTDVDLKTVMETSNMTMVSAPGAAYELREYYNGVATSSSGIMYEDSEGSGTISLKDIRLNHEYVLKQTTPPSNGDPLENDPEFKFKITPKKNGNGDITGFTVTPVGVQADPWIGLSTDDFVTIKNTGAPYFDYDVAVRAHGLWKHHGENSFTVKLEQKVTAGSPPRVYYKNVNFVGQAKDATVYTDCPLFGGTGNPNDETHIRGCKSTETETVTFENVEPGTYTITVLSPLRFNDSATLEDVALPPSPEKPTEITVVGKRQEYISNSTHAAYEFTIS